MRVRQRSRNTLAKAKTTTVSPRSQIFDRNPPSRLALKSLPLTIRAMPKQSIRDILEFFRDEARNNRDLGDKFKRLNAT